MTVLLPCCSSFFRTREKKRLPTLLFVIVCICMCLNTQGLGLSLHLLFFFLFSLIQKAKLIFFFLENPVFFMYVFKLYNSFFCCFSAVPQRSDDGLESHRRVFQTRFTAYSFFFPSFRPCISILFVTHSWRHERKRALQPQQGEREEIHSRVFSFSVFCVMHLDLQ